MNISLVERREVPTYLPLPLFTSTVPAGFPSPADDYIESNLDLNEYLIKHPDATYFARASGDSMIGKGIQDGALLVIDRSLEAKQDNVVIAVINGELTCKTYDLANRQLVAANPDYSPIQLNEDLDLLIEGVVVYAINPLCTL